MLKKGLILIIVFLFAGIGVIPSIDTAVLNKTSMSTLYNGSLSGYIKDNLGNPIEGAQMRVYFHKAYEEDYTDSNGYYHITNIPICYCIKNAVASKVGYTTERVLLSIDENTIYNFVLTALQYNGSLSGYVYDSSMNPIEGTRVRVCFHETYEEDYTDLYGYYYVTNIPICFCSKNCTAFKLGYKTEWVLLGIIENTIHDFVLKTNQPPNTPTINGPTRLKQNQEGTYSVSVIDPDGDQIYFYIDWGDGNIVDWDGPYNSGENLNYKHTWTEKDIYRVKVKAKDTNDAESDWNKLKLSVPRNRIRTNYIINDYFDCFTNLFLISKILLQRLE